jgi:hypothetical protein
MSAIEEDSWPELLGGLFQLSLSPEAEKRETAFRVFATTPGVIEKQHEDAVIQAFDKGFKDDSVSVRMNDIGPTLTRCSQSVQKTYHLLPAKPHSV